MTFHPGDIAECIETEWTMLDDAQPAIPFGARRMVIGTEVAIVCGLDLIGLRFVGSPWLYHEQSFRKIEPAPAQPHEAELQVHGVETNLSRLDAVFAAAGDNTDSNMVSLDPVENFSHTDRTEGATHRDLSQHAEAQFTNRNEIVVPHGEVL